MLQIFRTPDITIFAFETNYSNMQFRNDLEANFCTSSHGWSSYIYHSYADTNIFHGNIFEDAKLSMNNDAIKYNELNPKCEIIFGHIWFKHFLIIYYEIKYIISSFDLSSILNTFKIKSTPFTIHVSKISIT